MNVTKIELCNRVAKSLKDKSTGAADIKPILELFLDEIITVLSEEKKIEIRGFGAFRTKLAKKRVGRNPRTGEKVIIPQRISPVFKFSKEAERAFQKRSEGLKDS